MKLNLLVSAAAALCLSLPAIVTATPVGANGEPDQHSGRGEPGQVPPKSTAPAPGHPIVPVHPVAPVRPIAGAPGRPIVPRHPVVGQKPPIYVEKHPIFRRSPPARWPGLGGWTRGGPGWDRDRAGQDWRRDHGGWDRDAPWRHRQDWWRHHAAWRFYFGERTGFFFIPAFGYVSVPVEYQTHYWRAGEHLPNWFWRYQVREYWNYGLPQPPEGCMWVWVSNDVALIDMSDGYIIDIVHNAW